MKTAQWFVMFKDGTILPVTTQENRQPAHNMFKPDARLFAADIKLTLNAVSCWMAGNFKEDFPGIVEIKNWK